MLNKIILSLALCFSFTHCFADIPLESPPKETIILNLPNCKVSDWKEVSRLLVKEAGLIERIPKNQTVDNWNELIAIQYFTNIEKSPFSLNTIIDTLKKTTINAYPGSQVTWRLIEKNKSDFTYEWILHTPYKDIPIQHEIARGFLIENKYHRIGYTRRYKEMDQTEKNTWLKALKESVAVETMEKAKDLPGLSLVERFKNSIVLGNAFKDWSISNKYESANGYTLAIWVPASQKGSSFITECLEILTYPMIKATSITQLVEMETEKIRKSEGKAAQLSILKQTPNEIIYSYTQPKNGLQLTAVVRTFISECGNGRYSITYKQGLPEKTLSKDEIEKWQKTLESIKVRD